jgi:periplasmic copper chaperone A
MNRRLLLQLAAALSLTVASILAIATAGRAQGEDIEVREAFARATIGNATSGAVYLTIVNHASGPDRLVSASAPVAARTDLHMTVRDGDIVRMRRLESIEIEAGGTVAFEPGGAHVMLSGLAAPLVEGESFELTLEFEAAGSMRLEVPVKSIAAENADEGDGHGHGGH